MEEEDERKRAPRARREVQGRRGQNHEEGEMRDVTMGGVGLTDGRMGKGRGGIRG